jgi:hypothetical protein
VFVTSRLSRNPKLIVVNLFEARSYGGLTDFIGKFRPSGTGGPARAQREAGLPSHEGAYTSRDAKWVVSYARA